MANKPHNLLVDRNAACARSLCQLIDYLCALIPGNRPNEPFPGRRQRHQPGELSRIEGICVPEGFCVSTEAFKRIIGEAPSIGALLDRLSLLKASA